jgi:hypothetical protein
MAPSRYELSDLQWEKIKDFPPGRKEHVGRTAADNRLFVIGVLWVLRSGARWADLPERYSKYKCVHMRFMRWANSGVKVRAIPSSGNVFEDMRLPDAQELDTKARVGAAINWVVERRELTQAEIAAALEINQPEVPARSPCAAALQTGRLLGRAADAFSGGS